MSADIIITDIIKGYTHDQDKAVSPEETVARVKDRFRQSGIRVLEKTERIDNGRLDIPVYISECGGRCPESHAHPEADGKRRHALNKPKPARSWRWSNGSVFFIS